MPALKDRLDKLAAAVPDLKKGEVLSLTYVPDKGTVVGGAAKETVIPGQGLRRRAVLRLAGQDPVDGNLKKEAARRLRFFR